MKKEGNILPWLPDNFATENVVFFIEVVQVSMFIRYKYEMYDIHNLSIHNVLLKKSISMWRKHIVVDILNLK